MIITGHLKNGVSIDFEPLFNLNQIRSLKLIQLKDNNFYIVFPRLIFCKPLHINNLIVCELYHFALSLSLVCRCAKTAYEEGYKFFAIRLWAECWAGKDQNELDAFLVDQKQRSEQFCYSNITKTDFERCNDADSRICVGSEHGQYVYKLGKWWNSRKNMFQN